MALRTHDRATSLWMGSTINGRSQNRFSLNPTITAGGARYYKPTGTWTHVKQKHFTCIPAFKKGLNGIVRKAE